MMLISVGQQSRVDLEGYGQRTHEVLMRLLSAIQEWLRSADMFQGPGFLLTGLAGAAALGMFACIIWLGIRSKRERQKTQEEITNQTARAQAAESANTTKSEFLASLSHQIRTPLNAVVGYTDLALKTNLDPQVREYLDTVRTSADWLMHTVTDVLEFSQFEAGTVQLDNIPFSLSKCLRSAMKIVEREAAAKKLITACKIDPALPQLVCGDPNRLRHVIFNLLDNAVRFTSHGSVTLSATLENDRLDDVAVRIEVTDTGIGVSPAKRKLIFGRQPDEGEDVKSRLPVLGLPISCRLVELMGGTMTCQSQVGAGSTFQFSARFRKQKTAEPAAVPRAMENTAPKELSILVVEDNAVSRRLVAKVLESAANRVWTAANGKEALDYVKNEAFDLILMDMEMPDLDGLEATQAIRKDEAPGLRVPIYALTAHVLPSDRERCLAAGMDGFLTKPVAVDEVLQLVSKLGGVMACKPETEAAESLIDDETESKDTTASQPEVDKPWMSTVCLAKEEMESDHAGAWLQELGRPLTVVCPTSESEFALGTAVAVAEACELELEHLEEADESVASYELIEDSRLRVPGPLSAPEGLALLEAAWKPQAQREMNAKTLESVGDPFEQARKALANRRFDVRVIHNNGDPSDRNLI